MFRIVPNAAASLVPNAAACGLRPSAGKAGLLLLGAACLALVACQPPTLEVVAPLSVVNWSPQDGASGVCPSWPVSVCFNEPLSSSSLSGNVLLGTAEQCEPNSPIANGGTVTAQVQRGDVALSGGSASCVVITPTAPLTDGACYTIEMEGQDLGAGVGVAGQLADGGSDVLPVTLRSLFQVAPNSASCIGADAG
jgi:hypothetical protein